MMTRRSHRQEAALRPVGGVEEIQVVGAIGVRVMGLLGIATSAQSVWLHPDVVRHIEAQRQSSSGDAEFVLQHLAAAILRPHLVGVHAGDPRRMRVVHLVEAEGRYLLVALKIVRAADSGSQADEIWVSSAFPLGETSLTRLRKKHTLLEVDWGTDS